MEFYHKVEVLNVMDFFEKTELSDKARQAVPSFEYVVAGNSKKYKGDKVTEIEWYTFFLKGKPVLEKAHQWRYSYGTKKDENKFTILKKAIPAEIREVAIQKAEEKRYEDQATQ